MLPPTKDQDIEGEAKRAFQDLVYIYTILLYILGPYIATVMYETMGFIYPFEIVGLLGNMPKFNLDINKSS